MPKSANAAGELLERFALEDEQAFDASPDLVTFHLPDEKVDEPGVSLWSITPRSVRPVSSSTTSRPGSCVGYSAARTPHSNP